MLFRILTEDCKREEIAKLVERDFSAFTLIPSQGYWKGQRENSLTIEIDASVEWKAGVYALAQDIKTLNSQDAVLVQEIALESVLV